MTANFKTVNGEKVLLTAEEISAREAEEAAFSAYQAANGYKSDREAEYPSVVDQLDEIYHHGIDGWKAKIATIKAKYPKP
jgi:hypothetical protein